MTELKKLCVARGGKISFSEGGGGINTVSGPTSRPLPGGISYL
jgi:hypothetical protein